MRPPIMSYVTFNKMGSIVKSLTSLLTTNEDFELFIVDNDSRDKTWEYIQAQTDTRIKCRKKFDKNEGVINALNWILSHRADDQDFINFEPDVYNFNSKFVNIFREVGDTFDAGLVHACANGHRNDLCDSLEVIPRKRYGLYPSVYPRCTTGLFFWIPAGIMNSIGYYCEASYLADIDLNARITIGLRKRAGYTPHVQCMVINPNNRMGVGGYNCKECHLFQNICRDTSLFCNAVYPGASTNAQRLHYQFHDKTRVSRTKILNDRLSGKLPLKCNTHHLQTLEPWEEEKRCDNANFFIQSYEQYQVDRLKEGR